MLKKAGIAAAVATAGLLVLSPFAFAADDEVNGIDNGNNFFKNNNQKTCNESVLVEDTLLPGGASEGNCEVENSVAGQERSQVDRNPD